MEASESARPEEKKSPAARPAFPVLHRVRIQCNKMFRVTPDKFDARQCPDCHKD
jgi:hypothetical protein